MTPCLGPHAPDLLSGEMLERCAQASAELDVKMLIHVAQSEVEVAEVKTARGGKGSIHYLERVWASSGFRRLTWCGWTTKRSRSPRPVVWG